MLKLEAGQQELMYMMSCLLSNQNSAASTVRVEPKSLDIELPKSTSQAIENLENLLSKDATAEGVDKEAFVSSFQF